MAYGVSDNQLTLQQMLHGYSEGHRLLASSIELPARDAKAVLMMSDASGPAATIGEEGYLTGYPLMESGHYALARTWPAPELPRPGCVWTHTILIDFSDIPSLRNASGILKCFQRPQGDERAYKSPLTHVVLSGEGLTDLKDQLARRILFALYNYPSKPIVSAAAEVKARDDLVLSVWAQQWPRLKRAFRFCTLSFADRSSGNATFDLQFLPLSGRVRPAQFRGAIDADRQDLVGGEWLDDAITDLMDGADGGLRSFLRAAGSDVGGRESFAALATLHALSLQFASDPSAVERAVSTLEGTISNDQGQAARSLIARAAAAAADHLGRGALEFVVRNFDLIEPADGGVAAERVGRALWRIDPEAVLDILSEPTRSMIAERSIAAMPKPVLIEGIASTPKHLLDLLKLRPDIATETAYWAIPESLKQDALRFVGTRPDIAGRVIDAMIGSELSLAREARAAFGSDSVLRRSIALLEDPTSNSDAPRAWLRILASDTNAVSLILAEQNIGSFETLEVIARAVDPDAVPNALGEDPWVTAVRRISPSVSSPYLASFLLVRAFGRRSHNSAELTQLSFDTIYAAAMRESLPLDAWQLLDPRLQRSIWWPNWDKCIRIRHTVADMYVDREIDAASFLSITGSDDAFAELIDVAADSYRGQRYLKSVRDWLSDRGIGGERLRAIKRALW
jgi:GTPase-associated protein 1, N-terminal domain type 1